MRLKGLFDSGFVGRRLNYLILLAGSAALLFVHPLSAAIMLGVSSLFVGVSELNIALARRSLIHACGSPLSVSSSPRWARSSVTALSIRADR